MRMHAGPKVEQVPQNPITDAASRVAESRTACLIDESLRIARNLNQDPFRTLAISAYLQGIQDALTPPAPVAEQREWRAARDWKDDGATTGDIGTEEMVDVWVSDHIANPGSLTTNPRKQWRTPAGPWTDADTKGEA